MEGVGNELVYEAVNDAIEKDRQLDRDVIDALRDGEESALKFVPVAGGGVQEIFTRRVSVKARR